MTIWAYATLTHYGVQPTEDFICTNQSFFGALAHAVRIQPNMEQISVQYAANIRKLLKKNTLTYVKIFYWSFSDCPGYVLPPSFLEQSQNGKLPNWICNKCGRTTSSHHVQEVLDRIGQDLSEMKKGDSKVAKDFIKTYEKYLHSNHYYLTDVKLALSQLIGHEDESGLPGVGDEDLELKARLCQSITNLAKCLAPGKYVRLKRFSR